jgi:methyl-accepting chemotaxis protein
VLASAVKSLANPTAKITQEVGGQVGSVRSSAVGAVRDAAAVASTNDPIKDVTTMVDAAVDEQDAAAGQISRNAPGASQGSAEVAEKPIRDGHHAVQLVGLTADVVLVASAGLERKGDACVLTPPAGQDAPGGKR